MKEILEFRIKTICLVVNVVGANELKPLIFVNSTLILSDLQLRPNPVGELRPSVT